MRTTLTQERIGINPIMDFIVIDDPDRQNPLIYPRAKPYEKKQRFTDTDSRHIEEVASC